MHQEDLELYAEMDGETEENPMDNMVPEIVNMSFYDVETDYGSTLVPYYAFNPRDPIACTEGTRIIKIRETSGWFARLSADGYLDCTEWMGPFDSPEDALKELSETYGPEGYETEED